MDLSTATLHDAVDAASEKLTTTSKVTKIAPEPPQTVLRLVASAKN
jgi:hypothetical protein